MQRSVAAQGLYNPYLPAKYCIYNSNPNFGAVFSHPFHSQYGYSTLKLPGWFFALSFLFLRNLFASETSFYWFQKKLEYNKAETFTTQTAIFIELEGTNYFRRVHADFLGPDNRFTSLAGEW